MKICKVNECGNKVKSRGYCGKHYMRFIRKGDPEAVSDRMHGLSGTYEHGLWCNTRKAYPVCESWQHFINFYTDIGKKPTYNHWLVRIDESKPFGPDNFRWTLGKNK